MINFSFTAALRQLAGLLILGILAYSGPVPEEVPMERWVIYLTAIALIAPEILESVVRSYRQLRGLPDLTPPRIESSPTDGGDERGP